MIAQGYVLTVYKVIVSSANMIAAMIYVPISSLHQYASIHLVSPMSATIAQMPKPASCLKYSIWQTLPKNKGITMSVVRRKDRRSWDTWRWNSQDTHVLLWFNGLLAERKSRERTSIGKRDMSKGMWSPCIGTYITRKGKSHQYPYQFISKRKAARKIIHTAAPFLQRRNG